MQLITVVADDREKDAWDDKYLGPGFRFETKRLDVGDYTIKGMEKLVRIEKKQSWSEIAVNLSNRCYRESFILEMRNLSLFPIRALVIHSELSQIVKKSYQSRYVSESKKITLLNWAVNIPFEYGIPLICLPSKSKSNYLIQNLFRKIYEYNKTGRLFYFNAPKTSGVTRKKKR